MFKTPKALTITRVHWCNQATGPHSGTGIILQDPYECFGGVLGKCKAMCRPIVKARCHSTALFTVTVQVAPRRSRQNFAATIAT